MEVFRFKDVIWRGGGELYGVCSGCLTGSLSCQHWCGITCSSDMVLGRAARNLRIKMKNRALISKETCNLCICLKKKKTFFFGKMKSCYRFLNSEPIFIIQKLN